MPQTAEQILRQEYLLARAKILELAAALDRIERAEGNVDDDPQMQLLRRGFQVLTGEEADRAKQVQMLFSRPFADDWRKTLGV